MLEINSYVSIELAFEFEKGGWDGMGCIMTTERVYGWRWGLEKNTVGMYILWIEWSFIVRI